MSALLRFYSFSDLWHPLVFAGLLLVQAAYLLTVGPLRERFRWGIPATPYQQAWFSIGIWVVYLSEGTPLHILAERYLFSAHMLQHILLTMIVPPLLMLGTPVWMARWLTAWPPLYRLLRFLTHPAPALLIFNLIYSIWHMPIAYQATLWSHGFHMVQHLILVSTAFLMWIPIASPLPELPRLSEGAQMLYIFLQGVAQIAVFAIITFAETPIYDFYAQAPRIWSFLTPHIDQQMAGIIMKLGGMAIYLFVWAVVFFRWAAREGAHWDKPNTTTAD